jgi:hypothetical protein
MKLTLRDDVAGLDHISRLFIIGDREEGCPGDARCVTFGLAVSATS